MRADGRVLSCRAIVGQALRLPTHAIRGQAKRPPYNSFLRAI